MAAAVSLFHNQISLGPLPTRPRRLRRLMIKRSHHLVHGIIAGPFDSTTSIRPLAAASRCSALNSNWIPASVAQRGQKIEVNETPGEHYGSSRCVEAPQFASIREWPARSRSARIGRAR